MSVEKTAVRDTVRVFNKHVLNPAILHLAGGKHFYASTIGHTGRNSGRQYRTPVAATRVTDGFVIPLPYGSHTDWVCNLMAKSGGNLRSAGEDFEITSPTLVDAATAIAEMPPRQRSFAKRLGVRKFLHVNATPVADVADG